MSDGARFSDREMAVILRHAANLQASGDDERHSLADIQQIARQVGIPPELVAQAAARLASEGVRTGILGPSGSAYATRVVPAVVEPAAYAELVSLIRRTLRQAGQPSELAGALEWRHRSESGLSTTAVTVSPGPDSTTIRVEGEYGGQRTLTFLGAGLVTFLATMLALAAGGPQWGMGVAAGTALTGFVAARIIWDRLARRGARRVAALRDALAGAIARPASAPVIPGEEEQIRRND